MIVIYAGLSFLFYKIFPAVAGMEDNTVLGALLMGVVTAVILQAAEILAIRSFVLWQARAVLADEPALFPFGAGTIMLAGAALAALSCLLVAEGFASELARWGARHEVEFFIMAAIPPLAHSTLKLWELFIGASKTEHQRLLVKKLDAEDKR